MIFAITMAGALLAGQSGQDERPAQAAVASTWSAADAPIVRVGSKSASLVARQEVEMKRRLRDDGRDDAQTASASHAVQALFANPGKVKIVDAQCAKTLCQVQVTASAAATAKLIGAIDEPQAMSRAAAAGYRIVALASPATADSRGSQRVTLWLGQPAEAGQFDSSPQPV